MLMILIVMFGISSLIFAIWTFIGLLRYAHQAPMTAVRPRWLLGVCADFSHYVGIPLWIVRLYAIVYAPFLIGLLFYLLYYFLLKRRKTEVLSAPKTVQITKMDSRYYLL